MATEHKNESVKPNDDMDANTPPGTSDGASSPSAATGVSDLPSAHLREKPICLMIGPEKIRYFLSKSLLAAKSPFFGTMFKDCWDGDKEEVELTQVSNEGFIIVAHWIYSGSLPSNLTDCSQDRNEQTYASSLQAYKAADILMMSKLQNELILSEAKYLATRKCYLTVFRLKCVYNEELCHTRYCAFVLKCVMVNICAHLDSKDDWGKQLSRVENEPKLLADLLTQAREWICKPWNGFLKEDLTEFLVKEADQ